MLSTSVTGIQLAIAEHKWGCNPSRGENFGFDGSQPSEACSMTRYEDDTISHYRMYCQNCLGSRIASVYDGIANFELATPVAFEPHVTCKWLDMYVSARPSSLPWVPAQLGPLYCRTRNVTHAVKWRLQPHLGPDYYSLAQLKSRFCGRISRLQQMCRRHKQS